MAAERRAGVFVAALLASTAAALVSPWTARAQAQAPKVRFLVRATCPSQRVLVTAFGMHVQTAGEGEQGAWTVDVERVGPRRATLELRTPEGRISVRRTIASRDCRALAEAFAFIVLAQFVELHVLPEIEVAPAEPPPEPPPPPPPPEPEPAPTPPPAPAASQPVRAVAPAPPSAPPASPTAPSFDLGGALAAGADIGIGPGSIAPMAELAVSLAGPPRTSGWLARVAIELSLPTVQESATDRVERMPFGARLEAGAHAELARGAWLDVTAGGGVVAAKVTALDLDGQPSTLRVEPALTASSVLGIRLAPAWSVRLEVAGALYPVAERYVVQPIGVVAEAPRGGIFTTIGLQFDTSL